MTQVRIRHELSVEDAPVGETDLLNVDAVIPLLRRWGVRDADGDLDPDRLSGQFVFDPQGRRFYFEVMIGEDE